MLHYTIRLVDYDTANDILRMNGLFRYIHIDGYYYFLGILNRNGEDDEQEYIRMRLPNRKKDEIFALAEQLMGGSRIQVVCEDGKTRMGRIRGSIKKRKWIRSGDLLIVRPWDFQDDKADVLYRYTYTQASNLSRRGKLPDSVNVF